MNHSHQHDNLFFRLLLLILVCPVMANCSGNEDQRDFEREALSTPSGYTQTDGSGAVTGQTDSNDWRVAPFFQGLVEIRPAYPNPVQTTENVSIDIVVTGVESVNGYEVVVWFETGSIKTVHGFTPLHPGENRATISAIELGMVNTPESAVGLKRVLIFDGRDNLISYGDILVQ